MTRCAGCGSKVGNPLTIDADELPVCIDCMRHVEQVRAARDPHVDFLRHEAQRRAFAARYGEPGKGGGK